MRAGLTTWLGRIILPTLYGKSFEYDDARPSCARVSPVFQVQLRGRDRSNHLSQMRKKGLFHFAQYSNSRHRRDANGPYSGWTHRRDRYLCGLDARHVRLARKDTTRIVYLVRDIRPIRLCDPSRPQLHRHGKAGCWRSGGAIVT